ncbi:MAG: hypothetical protein J1F10_07315 [Muribaculaceae bacterium]|nr:hypothetical protein [Muribaculaceae bacterium]
MTDEINNLRTWGFTGFIPVKDLRLISDKLPNIRGVYVVIRDKDITPTFVEKGSGGFFKGKDPNVSIDELKSNWVKDSKIVYIGKAGDPGKKATIKTRLEQYLRFGGGKNVGHYGGRFIWQLSDAEELLFAWKTLPDEIPSEIEAQLIDDFKKLHNGKRPFANLK